MMRIALATIRCAGKITMREGGSAGVRPPGSVMNPTSPYRISSEQSAEASKSGRCEPNNGKHDRFNGSGPGGLVRAYSGTGPDTDHTAPHPDTPDAGSAETATA